MQPFPHTCTHCHTYKCYPPFRSCTQPSFGDKLTGEHRRNRESADVRRHDHRQIAVERGRRRHGRQPQSPVTQQQIDKILWNLPRLRAQSHATKRYLAAARPQVTHMWKAKDRSYISSDVRRCCSRSQRRHQQAQASDKMADRAERSDLKNGESD